MGVEKIVFSIVISNYNYERFIAQAIDSALALEWDDKEVIVVDDGSTDGSREVIASYGDRVRFLTKKNGGQISAANLGFANSRGDVIIFLDADDVLFPTVAKRVCDAWLPNTVKVQFPLYHTDANGERLGAQWPVFTEYNTPEWADRLKMGYYDTPPISGIAWSRDFLTQLFPLVPRDKGQLRHYSGFFDEYLSMLAPFFGKVVSIPEPLGLYRIHGANTTGINSFSIGRLFKNCEEDHARAHAATEILLQREILRPGAAISVELWLDHMSRRLIYKRFSRDYPFGDTLLMVFCKYCRAVEHAHLSKKKKAILLSFGTLVAWAPRRLAYAAFLLKEDRRHHPSPLSLIRALTRKRFSRDGLGWTGPLYKN